MTAPDDRVSAPDRARTIDAGAMARALAHYREPDRLRSVIEIIVTITPFLLLWAIMWLALEFGYWLALVLVVPAAGFLVRLFMIQHDCGHGAFFRSRLANDWVGRIIGVLTLTPYDCWRRAHAIHHATSGNLDRRGFGDIDTLTVCEYQSRSRWQRVRYRIYRHPLVLFGLGPAYLFLLQQRLPVGFMRSGWHPWLSAMATNLAIVLVCAVMIWAVGLRSFLLIHLPITLIGAAIGVWLFYVQHQFANTFWAHDEEWDAREAALRGSSYYDLPAVLRWFTANIGMHHVHHLCSRIPFYRLPQVLRAHPELARIGRITLRESLMCVRLALWDETVRRLISFRDLRTGGADGMHADGPGLGPRQAARADGSP